MSDIEASDIDLIIQDLRRTMSCIAGTIQLMKKKRALILKSESSVNSRNT